jgi:hypothetical protein
MPVMTSGDNSIEETSFWYKKKKGRPQGYALTNK